MGKSADTAPPGGGMDILDVGVHIKGHKILDYNGIRYSEGSGGVKEYIVSGTKATAKNAAFLKSIKPGDQLSLECINIQKDGVTNLSTNFRIIVTN